MSHLTPFLTVIILTAACHAKETLVSTSDQLQSALDNASPGEIIQLASGTYNGPFTIERSGSPKCYITLETTAEKVKIEGKGGGGVGLTILGDYWAVRYLHIAGFDTGVLVKGASVVLDALAVLNVNKGVEVEGFNGTVAACAVEAKEIGIRVKTGDYTVLDANSVRGSDTAIKVDKGTCCGKLTGNVAGGQMKIEGNGYRSEGNVIIETAEGK